MVSIKTTLKSYGVIIICFCTIFLETLFLSYKLDLKELDPTLFTQLQLDIYNAQVSMCNMMNLISIFILGLFSFVLLFFSIERYIEENKQNMGVLKAIGYTNNKLSLSLMKYSIPVFIGSLLGYIIALLFSKLFYNTMNKDHVYPDVSFSFNIYLCLILILTLAILTLIFAYLVGRIKLKMSPLDMINQVKKSKKGKMIKEKKTFLTEVRSTMLKNNIPLILFVGFATLCFSATIQMSFSIYNQANTSPLFFWMMFLIGILLGITIMILAFRFIFTNNKKHLSILKAYGYENKECYYAIYGGYLIVAIISFIIGTIYQAILMSIMFKIFSSAYEIKYHFDFLALIYSLIIFIITYISINVYYYNRISKLKLDSLNCDLN